MATSRTPGIPAEDRATVQRERILNAAKRCFIEYGFHAASMVAIAEAASISPGLIYRYFAGKDAIILAIMERQLADSRAAIRALHGAANFEDAVLKVFVDWRDGSPRIMNAALFLEISAGAARNAELAAALRASDRAIREELTRWLAAPLSEGGKGVPPGAAAKRAVMLQIFMEGMAIRALREPDLDLDLLKAAIRRFLDAAFAGE